MRSISRSQNRSGRPSVLRHLALSALLGAAALGAACSGSPVGPGALSSERRVGTGGAGGTISPGCTLPDICQVTVTSTSGTLTGDSDVAADSLTAFGFRATLSGKDGRFSQGGYIEVTVHGSTATIEEISFRRGESRLGDEHVTVPATVEVREDGCGAKGDLVTTTITGTFEGFGPTTIVEQHCYGVVAI